MNVYDPRPPKPKATKRNPRSVEELCLASILNPRQPGNRVKLVSDAFVMRRAAEVIRGRGNAALSGTKERRWLVRELMSLSRTLSRLAKRSGVEP